MMTNPLKKVQPVADDNDAKEDASTVGVEATPGGKPPLSPAKKPSYGAEKMARMMRLNPFAAGADAEPVHAPWHVDFLFTASWVAIVALFAVNAIAAHVNRGSLETIRLARQSDGGMPPIALRLEMACSTAWSCVDASGGARPTAFVEVRHSYDRANLDCAGATTNTSRAVTVPFSIDAFDTAVCYSRDYGDGLDVTIPFDRDFAYGDRPFYRVTITSPGRSDIYTTVDMEPYQRKTVFVGQWLKERPTTKRASSKAARETGLRTAKTDIDRDSSEPYVADLFYDGKNANTTALLRVRVSQFANVATLTRPGSWFSVISSIGGANALIFAIASNLRQATLKVAQDKSFLSCFLGLVQKTECC